jgi:phosphopantothenoylcysteine synthetase/decarboxylase
MVSVDIVNAALADLVVQGNLATAKIEELANDIESKLLAAIAVNAQQITTVVAGIQAEIDKVAPAPVVPPAPEPIPASEVPQG